MDKILKISQFTANALIVANHFLKRKSNGNFVSVAKTVLSKNYFRSEEMDEENTEEAEIAPFPVDESTLLAVEHALGAYLEIDDESEDEPQMLGAEYSIWQLFDFLSGVSEEDYVVDDNFDYETDAPVYICMKPTYDYPDLIHALIDEIRRLRELVDSDKREIV